MWSTILAIIFTTRVCSTVVDERILAVAMVKGHIAQMRADLIQFKDNVNEKTRMLENHYLSGKHDEVQNVCLKSELQMARMETQRLLNMLVNGETNELLGAGKSVDDRNLSKLHELWGAVVVKGSTRGFMKKEMHSYAVLVDNRFQKVEENCNSEPGIPAPKPHAMK